MTTSISKAALILTTNATAMLSGLKQAGSQIKSFVTSSSATLKTVGAGVTFGGIAAGTALAIKGLQTLEDIAKTGKLAQSLNLSAEAASGLFGVLGQYSDLGENLEGLTQFKQKVADAYNGVGEEAAKLFQGMSVSAADIINLPIDEQFYRVHAAIRELDQDQQMFKLSMLGGSDSMKKWIPLLSMSNAELRKQAQGYQISTEKMASAMEAQDRVKEATNLMNNMWRDAVIAAAPLVSMLASEIPNAANKTSGAFAEAGVSGSKFFENMALDIAAVADIAKILTGTIAGLSVEFVKLGTYVVDPFDSWLGMREYSNQASAKAAELAASGINSETTKKAYEAFYSDRGKRNDELQRIKEALKPKPTSPVPPPDNGKKVGETIGKAAVAEIGTISSSMLKGTQEAFDIQARFLNQGLNVRSRGEQQQLAEARKANNLLAAVERNTRASNITIGVF